MKNFNLKINGTDYNVNIKSHKDNIIDLDVNGSSYSVELEKKEDYTTPVIVKTHIVGSKPKEMTASGVKKLVSPLPGTIVSIKAKEGDTIKIGDSVLVLEAMKMENDIQSEFSGKIKKINISVGNSVLQGDVLIEIE